MKLSQFIFTSLIIISPWARAEKVAVRTKGMVCGFCAQGIEKKFKALPEIKKINVSLESKIVELETKDGQSLTDEKIKSILTDAGYESERIERFK